MPESEIYAKARAKTDGIEHVVLLMLENHSFDQMLGALQAVYPDLDGVPPAASAAKRRSNRTSKGQEVFQRETTERQMAFDPKHEHVNAMAQLAGGNGGFVTEFEKAYPSCTREDLQDVMGYYRLDFLPALHALGRNYTVCDRWFSSLPGPTWPNRFFALSGTCAGQVLMPSGAALAEPHWYTEQKQPTIFTRLSEREKSWCVYHYDFPSSLVLVRQREPECLRCYEPIGSFFDQATKAEHEFPAFAFIEPQYFGVAQNDDHPPHNVMKAEKLIGDVYNALRSNAALWAKTLLVVVYDEHGGFYDHVAPPRTVAPDGVVSDWGFDRLGVRVPALLVSPLCGARVEHTVFDHTSLLKYLQDKWELGDLGHRTAQANSIGCALGTAKASNQVLPFIRVPNEVLVSDDPDAEKDAVNDHQRALHQLADFLLRGMPDRMGQEAVNLAADTQRIPGAWACTKHWLGGLAVRFGQWLSQDVRRAQETRRQRTAAAVEALKARATTAPAPPARSPQTIR